MGASSAAESVNLYIKNPDGTYSEWDGAPKNQSPPGDGEDGLKVTDTNSHKIDTVIGLLQRIDFKLAIISGQDTESNIIED